MRPPRGSCDQRSLQRPGNRLERMSMKATVTAAVAGMIDVGGDLTAARLGYGAMRITGPGVWGEPPDRDRARAAPRRAVDLGVTFIDTADAYGPEVSERLIARDAVPVSGGTGHRDQGWPWSGRARAASTGRPAQAPAPCLRGEPGPAAARPDRPVPAPPELLRRPAQGGGAGDPGGFGAERGGGGPRTQAGRGHRGHQ